MEGKQKREWSSHSISNRCRKKKPVFINCSIGDALTPTSCTKIVKEIAKYILCHKLIPYPYDALKNTAHNLNRWSVENSTCLQRRKATRMKRHHKKVVEAYENFESIFQNLHLELQNCVACDDVVQEVVLLIGATTRSPKEVYRILVPPVSCREQDQKQSEGKILLNLIRCIVMSEDLNDLLDRPMAPTNLYVMLKKKHRRPSDWFVPKDSYSLPLCGRQAIIVLGDLLEQQVIGDAVCKKTTISQQANINIPVNVETKFEGGFNTQQASPMGMINNEYIVPIGMHWFQSHVSLKGFRSCKKSGLSVGSS